jgi:hypothetical protein
LVLGQVLAHWATNKNNMWAPNQICFRVAKAIVSLSPGLSLRYEFITFKVNYFKVPAEIGLRFYRGKVDCNEVLKIVGDAISEGWIQRRLLFLH